MGNQTSKTAKDLPSHLFYEICSLTCQDYFNSYRLSNNPFSSCLDQDVRNKFSDLQISLINNQAQDTMSNFNEIGQVESINTRLKSQNSLNLRQSLQKNQLITNKIKKVKKICKQQKKQTRRIISTLNHKDQQNHSSSGLSDQIIRDQNNCKSYHKLVKNYLIERGLQNQIAKYETKYHTRYYFIVALIIIKYLLKQNFSTIYQKMAEQQLGVQQKKIDKKLSQLKNIRQKIEINFSRGLDYGNLKVKQLNLENQIDHIKVVKYQIGNYSIRSCRAYFQGEIEESLKILYLKNDPVMRKRYYFEQALEIIKDIQLEMRKISSHR